MIQLKQTQSLTMKQIPIKNQLTPRQAMIYRILQKHDDATNKYLLQKCSATFGNISRITMVRDLNDLVRMQYAMRCGRGRGVTYVAQKKSAADGHKQHIPLFLKKYFWDTDISKLSLTKHATYIIERILEWGNLEAVRWLRERYTNKELLSVLEVSRSISHKSWHFWKLILLPSNKHIPCTRKFSDERQKKVWQY